MRFKAKKIARAELSFMKLTLPIIYSGYVVTGSTPSLCAQSVVCYLFNFISGLCGHLIPIEDDILMTFFAGHRILTAGMINIYKLALATDRAPDSSRLFLNHSHHLPDLPCFCDID